MYDRIEWDYKSKLKRYLKQNYKKSEYDFLRKEIKILEKKIRELEGGVSDEYIIKDIIKDSLIYENFNKTEKSHFLKNKLISYKSNISDKIKGFKDILFEYQIKLHRLKQFSKNESTLNQDNTTKEIENNRNIKFNLSQTQIIEIVKALIENNNVNGLQKDIINLFAEFFGVEIKNPDKLIQDIKNRSNGSETLFLNNLKSSLLEFITKEKTR